jgi:competence protein ComEA
MFSLTPRERKVLVFLGILIFCGALLRFLNVKINNVSASTNNQNQIQEAIPININTASLADLEKIPGIGPEIASRIIEYRATHGKFSSFDDLKEVKGIGGKKLEKMKDSITLQSN